MSVGFETEKNGFYCKIGTDFVGVYPSTQGMKLFYNRDVYHLNESCWDVEIVIGKKESLFIFYWMGDVKISFRFAKHLDFFLWLHQLVSNRMSRSDRNTAVNPRHFGTA